MGVRGHRAKLRLVEADRVASEADASRDSDPSLAELAADDESRVAQDVVGTPLPGLVVPSSRAKLDDLPDGQLVALGCKGDPRALELLYRRHAAFAIHLAARIEGSSNDVEDIAHDAFVRAFERLNDLADKSAFRAWLGAIVVHRVRSRMRRARLMSLLGMGKTSDPVDLDAIASPDASPHIRAQIAQIYALLRTLPTDERIAWTLRAIEGHDLETVARLTRCSLATVKRRITRAQRFLDNHFVDPQGAEEGARTSDAPQTAARPKVSSASLSKKDPS